MKNRIAAGLLLLCLFVLSLQSFAYAEALAKDPYEDWIWEPFTEKDDSLPTGIVTRWACVAFGSYPQTEIVPSAFTAVDDYALQAGDFLVDPGLYETLSEAEWNGNETELGGVRYLRLNRESAVNSAADRPGHYRWEDKTEWHYFRFDPI